MTNVNISINSDGLNSEQATALSNFLNTLAQGTPTQGTGVIPISEGVQPAEDKPKATRNRSKKVEEVKEEPIDQEAVNEIETTTEPEDDDFDAPTESKKVTLQEIRSLVFEKKDAHKDTIKAELSRIGAASIPTIEEKDYGHFYSFLLSLK